MTPLEELQAAHKRLSELHGASRSRTPGHWSNDDDDEPMMRQEIVGSHGAVGAMYEIEHADLIVTLHRTIDAQLMTLRAATSLLMWASECGLVNADLVVGPQVALARAINGKRA